MAPGQILLPMGAPEAKLDGSSLCSGPAGEAASAKRIRLRHCLCLRRPHVRASHRKKALFFELQLG